MRMSVHGTIFDVDFITDTFSNDRLLFKRGCLAWSSNILRLFITRLLYYTPRYKVNMASESATTSPPALARSSFSIENLLNLSQGATEKKPTAKLSAATLTCDSLRRPSFPLVPQVVRPFAYHAPSLPLCTPDPPGLNFGGIPHPRSEPSMNHFPVPNNGPPLGKLKRGVHLVITCPWYIVPVARKVRPVATPLYFILHRVNGWKSSHNLNHKLIAPFVTGMKWDVHTTFV